MFTEIYIEALLVNEELTDQVWEAWDAGEIDNLGAWLEVDTQARERIVKKSG